MSNVASDGSTGERTRDGNVVTWNAKPLNGRLRYVSMSREGRVVRRTPGKRVPSGIQGSNPCPGAFVTSEREEQSDSKGFELRESQHERSERPSRNEFKSLSRRIFVAARS